MQGHEPSRTALGAAGHRAAHQLLEGGSVFRDPFALAILGTAPDAIAREAAAEPSRRALRLLIAARSRLAGEALAAAQARGVRQAVVLGAGLDTLALRHLGEDLGVFEVDHPATQAWKRERLAAAGLAVPETLTFAPVDFEREELADGLAQAGFDAGRPAFFAWLGVVPYLTAPAIMATLTLIASVPGAEVVFDYAVPRERVPPERRAQVDALSARVAAVGEPLRSAFEPRALGAQLRELGFTEIDDLGPGEIRARLLGADQGLGGGGEGPHLVRARRP